jgi:hypothetical protein
MPKIDRRDGIIAAFGPAVVPGSEIPAAGFRKPRNRCSPDVGKSVPAADVAICCTT